MDHPFAQEQRHRKDTMCLYPDILLRTSDKLSSAVNALANNVGQALQPVICLSGEYDQRITELDGSKDVTRSGDDEGCPNWVAIVAAP